MLSLPDFKQKQILFINTLLHEGKSSIKLLNQNIVYSKDDKIINRISCHKAFAVFIIGDITLTSKLIQQANDFGVSFFLLKRNFSLYAAIQSRAEGNYLLRILQYQLDSKNELALAKNIISNKISNQLKLLKNSLENSKYRQLQTKIKLDIANTKDSQSLMGIEGNISKLYFAGYFQSLDWLRRTPKTKQDIPNLLLDIGYTFLFNFIDSLLQLYGFDTYKGIYHKLFFQRKSLSCDLMEPFRCVIDKALLKAYNLKQIDTKDFEFKNGKFGLNYQKSNKYSFIFMQAIMDHKTEMYTYTRGFYLHLMNPDKNLFPDFKIKTR
jgi:CRISPR-associated protein Cas1